MSAAADRVTPRSTLVRPAMGVLAGLAAASGAHADGWEHFAGTPSREARTDAGLPGIGVPTWVAAQDDQGMAVKFVGQAGVVCDSDRVYALGEVGGEARLLAFARADGVCVWAAPAERPQVSSWSTPAVDAGHGTVLVAAGEVLRAYDAGTGQERWHTDLEGTVVNASPLVTSDRGKQDRAFITDYDGFGDGARLYCVNVDPFDAGANPFQPGQVVWSAAIGSAAGSTPAYAGGVVYVAVAGPGGLGAGRVAAFDAGAVQEPAPLWMFENPSPLGFFGGLSVADGAVYAATYAYAGGRESANLVKIDAGTGDLLWSVGCNRTDSTPVVLGDGRVVLSGGIGGFGSLPTVQVFRDLGGSAVMEWDSARATWDDLDHDGVIEPGEYTPMGGWMHQPLLSRAGGGHTLLVGAIPVGGEQYGPCTDLYQIDLDAQPDGPGWIIGRFGGAGSTPAAAGGSVYTVGAQGLFAFNRCEADCDGSGGLDLFDFLCFVNSFAARDPYGDCNGDGAWTLFDFLCFQNRFAGGCP